MYTRNNVFIQRNMSSEHRKNTREFIDEGVYGKPHLIITCVALGLVLSSVYFSGQYLPPSKPVDSPLNEFSGDRARKHLEAITYIGPRPTGSYALGKGNFMHFMVTNA